MVGLQVVGNDGDVLDYTVLLSNRIIGLAVKNTFTKTSSFLLTLKKKKKKNDQLIFSRQYSVVYCFLEA